jgi:hypothetical protein
LVGTANVHGHWFGSKVVGSDDELHTVAIVAIANAIYNADGVVGVRICHSGASANDGVGLSGEKSGGLAPCPIQ